MNEQSLYETAAHSLKLSSESPIRALILDDSAVDRQRIKRICRQTELNIQFFEAGTIAEFASKIDADRFDVFFIDYRLVQGDGLIALEMLRKHPQQRGTASIMVAGEGQIQVAVDAMKSGCTDFLLKDMLGPEMLYRAISHARASTKTMREMRVDEGVQSALLRFAKSSSAEMRSILSAMLRRTRTLRHAAASSRPVSIEDVAHIDKNCARLWEFLEEYQAFLSEACADPKTIN